MRAGCRARCARARLVSPIRVIRDYSYCSTRFYGPGYLLAGDAACFIDPVFSTGVHLACLSGYLAAQTVGAILHGAPEETAQRQYDARYRAAFERYLNFLYFFYDHHSDPDSYFWTARKILNAEVPLDTRTAFVRLMSGGGDLAEWRRGVAARARDATSASGDGDQPRSFCGRAGCRDLPRPRHSGGDAARWRGADAWRQAAEIRHLRPGAFRMTDVAVLIPALNCGATIGPVVAGARRYVSEVLVVSDGSTDQTGAAAAAAGARVIAHDSCRGKGAALLTGLRALAENGVSRVLTMDGDGQHLPEEIPKLLAASASAPGALIIGRREFETLGTTAARLFGNRFANRWVEIACGHALPDTQSGFRVYPLRETLALGLRARHFALETEVLIRAVRAGLTIRSVPVRVYYPPVEERVSHFRPFRDAVRIVCVVVGLILRVW